MEKLVDSLNRQHAPEVLDGADRLLVVGDAEYFVQRRGELHLDTPVVGVPLKQRPVAEPACLVSRSARKSVNGFDLPARADEAHPAPRLANFEAGGGILIEGLDPVRSGTADD